ncbi:MAG: hypothetical protein KF864_00340 [Phycisphaeraceae bacterium]|jgi:hypothetical protein|nr:hypothetical protein [Phycisphaeraceae bacterium]MBX3410563.1 hypothetical protein [Phycisphaeraceae bacterium]
MSPDQLRTALRELNGERDCAFVFFGMSTGEAALHVQNAMLIPDEPDHLVKVTDGKSVYIVDAERVVWIRIGLGHSHSVPVRP